MLGIALQGDTISDLKKFQARHKASYPIAVDVQNKFGGWIEGIPLTIVVDNKGMVREVHDGFDAKTTGQLKIRYLKLLNAR